MSASPTRLGYAEIDYHRFDTAGKPPTVDHEAVVVEEPLEVRVNGNAVLTVMRTPGQDRDLVLGLAFAEGIVSSLDHVAGLVLCDRDGQIRTAGSAASTSVADAGDARGNVVNLRTASGAPMDEPAPRRASMSSCGVCGKRTIEDVLALAPVGGDRIQTNARFSAKKLGELPDALRQRQSLFKLTGALHGAAIFDQKGELLAASEDVGRHNAVDKVVGCSFLEGRLPLSRHVLQVSGRVSFEIVQKAYRAGIPLVTAISGVSSLAATLAEEAGITLIGFSRDGSFNVYAHPERIHSGIDA